MKFTKTYCRLKFQGLDEQFVVTVISQGDSVEDILSNTELVLTDEFGDDGPTRDLNELDMQDYYMIQYDITEQFINHQAEYFSRSH